MSRPPTGGGGPANDPSWPPEPIDDGPDDAEPTNGDDQPRGMTVARAGSPLPIAYGNVKLPARLIEDAGPLGTAPPRRLANYAYRVGQTVIAATVWSYTEDGVNFQYSNTDCVYRCIQAGTSSAFTDFGYSYGVSIGETNIASAFGQSGFTTLTDGGVVWQFLQNYDANPNYKRQTRSVVAALCEGEVVQARRMWFDKEKIAAVSSAEFGRSMFLARGVDALNQSLGFGHPSGYQHTALANAAELDLGTDKDLPPLAFEIEAVMLGTSGSLDVNPADILVDLLTHTRRGAGWGGSKVDATTTTGAGASSWRTYCDAMGWRVSWVIDQQRTVLSLLADLASATNSDMVWSQGAIKVVSRGDVAIASPVFGAVGYVPSNTSVGSLGPADFLDELEPVRVVRSSAADVFNSWPIEYVDRAQNNYQRTTVEDPEQLDVDARGLRRAPTTSLPFIYPNGQGPVALSRILAQRSVNIRNTYEWRTSPRWCLLEPGDVVMLTEPALGLASVPVRIVEVADDGDTFSFRAEDYPAAVSHSQGYTPAAPGPTLASYVDSLRIVSPGAGGNGPVLMTAPALADNSVQFDNLSVNALKTKTYGEGTPAWVISTAYALAATVYANGNTYLCTTAGTSAGAGSGPSGTGAYISDGTCRWRFVCSGRGATVGAKIDNAGIALKVAPGNLLIGTTLLSSTVLASSWIAGAHWVETTGGGGATWVVVDRGINTALSVTSDKPNNRFVIKIKPEYAPAVDPQQFTGLLFNFSTGAVICSFGAADGAGGIDFYHNTVAPSGEWFMLVVVAAPPW